MNFPIIKLFFTTICFFYNSKKDCKLETNPANQSIFEDKIDSAIKLVKSLKRTEFINFFEMQIQNDNDCKYSLEFLQTLEQMRTESKVQTFELIYNSAA